MQRIPRDRNALPRLGQKLARAVITTGQAMVQATRRSGRNPALRRRLSRHAKLLLTSIDDTLSLSHVYDIDQSRKMLSTARVPLSRAEVSTPAVHAQHKAFATPGDESGILPGRLASWVLRRRSRTDRVTPAQ